MSTRNGDWDVLAPVASLFASHGFTRDVADAIAGLLPARPGRVLVVGAGLGTLLTQLVESSTHILGVDSSREMARECRRNGVPCVCGDGRHLPLSDGSWDTVVITTGVLDCLDDDDARAVLQEAQRVSGQAGQVVASHLNHRTRLGFYERWGLIREGAVWAHRKIDLWRVHRVSPENEGPGMLAMCSFFDHGVSTAKDAGLSEEAFFAALPAWQRCRSREELGDLLASADLGCVTAHIVGSARAHVLVGVPIGAPNDSSERPSIEERQSRDDLHIS